MSFKICTFPQIWLWWTHNWRWDGRDM